jgi:hypothetical protein
VPPKQRGKKQGKRIVNQGNGSASVAYDSGHDSGRAQSVPMAASMTALERIRTEIRALEHELDRREDQEKRRLKNANNMLTSGVSHLRKKSVSALFPFSRVPASLVASLRSATLVVPSL